MSRLLFPRLSDVAAKDIWKSISELTVHELARHTSTTHEFASYAQTGGTRTSIEHLEKIRKSILDIAQNNGYPDNGNRESRAKFDAETTRWIYEHARIPVGEALHREMWTFMVMMLIPDVARWRFLKAGESRFTGGVRNTLQRLWLRAFLLSSEKNNKEAWQLVNDLTEDAFVAITERPGLSSNPEVARAIGLGWKRMARRIGKNKMEAVHRGAMIRLKEISPVINLDVLNDEQLYSIIDNVFESSANTHFKKSCSSCNGTGLIKDKLCSDCNGNGFIEFVQVGDQLAKLCQHCKGSGFYKGQVCTECSGYGEIGINDENFK